MRWTLLVQLTMRLKSGRRSRVVLTPRRWRQVGRDASRIVASDGGNKARLTRKSTKETVKTNRVRECRVIPARPAVD
jgi:hypothetical protein